MAELTQVRCPWFIPLSPGHAAICMKRWEKLPWNAAVPLTTKDGACNCPVGARAVLERETQK